MHDLLMECWSGDSLSRVASVVGMPRFAYAYTSKQKKLKYARVLVEVDAFVPLAEKVDTIVGERNIQQSIRYKFDQSFVRSVKLLVISVVLVRWLNVGCLRQTLTL